MGSDDAGHSTPNPGACSSFHVAYLDRRYWSGLAASCNPGGPWAAALTYPPPFTAPSPSPAPPVPSPPLPSPPAPSNPPLPCKPDCWGSAASAGTWAAVCNWKDCGGCAECFVSPPPPLPPPAAPPLGPSPTAPKNNKEAASSAGPPEIVAAAATQALSSEGDALSSGGGAFTTRAIVIFVVSVVLFVLAVTAAVYRIRAWYFRVFVVAPKHAAVAAAATKVATTTALRQIERQATVGAAAMQAGAEAAVQASAGAAKLFAGEDVRVGTPTVAGLMDSPSRWDSAEMAIFDVEITEEDPLGKGGR